MKQFFTIAIVLFTTLSAYSQSFEGKLTYQNSFTSKMENMTSEQFTGMMGTVQEYYIKEGNYKSVSNGSFSQWQLYINSENKLYSKLSNSEVIFWNDGNVNSDSIMSVVLNKDVVEILDYKCDELILNCRSGIQKYYFNSSISVNSKLYENHKYGNWSAYISQSNALPLKIIIENAQFTMTSLASEVTSMELEKKTFELPENSQTAKSPY